MALELKRLKGKAQLNSFERQTKTLVTLFLSFLFLSFSLPLSSLPSPYTFSRVRAQFTFFIDPTYTAA
jgi:hypothetical protein